MPKKSSADFSDITRKIAPVSEQPDYFSMLIYGESGRGKTACASTWPKPMLLIDVNERGTDTIVKVPGIDVIRPDDWEEIERTYWFLRSCDHKYKSVVIDQITQMQDFAMGAVREDNSKNADDVISKRDWGQISGKMKTWLFNYRDLIEQEMYVVFVAHQRTNNAEEGVEDQIDPTIGARLMPSLASAVNGAVSAIGNVFIKEEFEGVGKDKVRHVKYCMRIGPHAYYVTKIRRPIEFVAPDIIVNPTFEKIQKIIKGEKTEPRRKKI